MLIAIHNDEKLLWLVLSNVLIYGRRNKPLKVGLMLCPFIRITILDCPLGPVTYPTTNEFHFTEQALESIRRHLVMSLMFMALLHVGLSCPCQAHHYCSSKRSQLSETEDGIFPLLEVHSTFQH